MKKIILLLLLLPALAFAQLKYPREINSAEKSNAENFQQKEVWLEWRYTYVMKFDQNTIGVKHLFDTLEIVLKLNNFNFEKTQRNTSYLASYVKDIRNYEILNASILSGDSEVKMLWDNGISSYISIKLDKKEYIISMTKPE